MNTPEDIPAPASIKIDCGHQTLEVMDLSKPVWFGPYQDGKLGIYEAIVTGHVVPDSVTYVCTYLNHAGKDFVCYSTYSIDTPVDDIVHHLQENVFKAYEASCGESIGTFFVDPVGYAGAQVPTIH